MLGIDGVPSASIRATHDGLSRLLSSVWVFIYEAYHKRDRWQPYVRRLFRRRELCAFGRNQSVLAPCREIQSTVV